MVRTGLDLAVQQWPVPLRGTRIGLLCHPASINRRFEHAADVFLKHPSCKVAAFFGPQHGIRGSDQANMVEWEGARDSKTGLMVYSLYGRHRKPMPTMLQGLDALVVDLSDVGARYYTYIWTLYLCMEACAEAGKSIVVLDRPNPINGLDIEGPVLDPCFASFVGLKPLPIRHGMTVAEIARYFKSAFLPAVDLHILPMKGWSRRMFFDETGLPWAMPSPNIPALESALVYPGMCLLEGTNLSEGRGTTRPFEIFGAPYLDADRLCRRLMGFNLPALHFRPLHFKPTFDKFCGQICNGAQIHILDRRKIMPFKTGLAVIRAAMELAPRRFHWLKGPYEYEARKKPIDILFGTDVIRKSLESGRSLDAIEKSFQVGLRAFKPVRAHHLLY